MEIKGYYSKYGYYGLVGNRYMLFASESEYLDYIAELLTDTRQN